MKKLFQTIQKLTRAEKNTQSVPHYIKRPIRINIHELHQVYFERNNERIIISNMNSKGFGFLGKSFSVLPAKGDVLKGVLIIEGSSFPLDLEVVYSGKNVGCKIKSISRECLNEISQYFSFEILALSLYPLNSDHLKKDPDGTPRIFVGEDNCELFFVENNKNLVKFSLTIFGNYLEVDKNQNVRHGKILDNAEDGEKEMTYKKATIIQTSQDALSEEQKNKIERFILNIENLNHEYKNEMIKLMKTKQN